MGGDVKIINDKFSRHLNYFQIVTKNAIDVVVTF